MHRHLVILSLIPGMVALPTTSTMATDGTPGANVSEQNSLPQGQNNCIQTGMRCIFLIQMICCHGYCDQITQRCKNNGGVGNCIQIGMQCNPLNQMRRCCYGYCDQLTQECRNNEGEGMCLPDGQPCIRNGVNHCCSSYCSTGGYCQSHAIDKESSTNSTDKKER
ncbi:lectin-like [Pomacea canaliculata]|uniref:lectin-like n=1 Tax=Pomacea canaliculata TaxID=400727 RepID=UPI000D7387AA|nr:lectin-like [Pomacea canaliculata]XP_025091261.1 lectin-like [Pomacea canaliculata]